MIRSEIVTPVVPAVTKIAAAIALPEVRLVVFATRGLGWIIAPVCPTSLIDFETVTCSLNGTPVLHTYTVSFGAAAAIAACMVVYWAGQPTMTPALLTTLAAPNSTGAQVVRNRKALLKFFVVMVIQCSFALSRGSHARLTPPQTALWEVSNPLRSGRRLSGKWPVRGGLWSVFQT